jgi:2-polyprenyl-3-methyl-5-hydroxy-6-metoxy-1,4-benzoquinol methylase
MRQTFLHTLQPERGVDNFSVNDSTLLFYTLTKAAMQRVGAKQVLDYGAGRGSFMDEVGNPNKSQYRVRLQDLRTTGAKVTAADLDPVVKTHQASDVQVLFQPNEALPFKNAQFDVVVSDWTLEHVETPALVASELLRITKPGGFICARTTNGFSYLRVAASLIPNALHAAVLKYIQPGRKEMDIFPTFYRLNSKRALRQAFAGHEVHVTRVWGDPAYYFGNPLLFRIFQLTHKLLPSLFAPTLFVFIQKKS